MPHARKQLENDTCIPYSVFTDQSTNHPSLFICACAVNVASGGMQYSMEYRGSDVKVHIWSLCGCLLDEAFHSMSDADGLLASLQRPSRIKTWDVNRRGTKVRALVHLVYDILLLRKWMWYGGWDTTPLSPLCWCVARGYEYNMIGRKQDGEKLAAALKNFTDCCKQPPPFGWSSYCSTLDQVSAYRRRSPFSSSWHYWQEAFLICPHSSPWRSALVSLQG